MLNYPSIRGLHGKKYHGAKPKSAAYSNPGSRDSVMDDRILACGSRLSVSQSSVLAFGTHSTRNLADIRLGLRLDWPKIPIQAGQLVA